MAPMMQIPVATHVTLENVPNAAHTALLFNCPDGPVGVAVYNQELSRFAELLIQQAGKVAAKVTPSDPPAELTATPILVSHLGFAQGRSETEALMSFQVGNLRLTFAVELPMLHSLCTHLLSNTSVVQSKPKTN